MLSKILIMVATFYTVVQNKDNKSSLEYVFEIVRHGARAPYFDDLKRFHKESREMLTPQGMRQRYLLGIYNYETYIKPLIKNEKRDNPNGA